MDQSVSLLEAKNNEEQIGRNVYFCLILWKIIIIIIIFRTNSKGTRWLFNIAWHAPYKSNCTGPSLRSGLGGPDLEALVLMLR